tara:strand:- start:373 stop:1524 length:1152 start_codon:yes stop_codon:yes gene_type:complete
MKKKKKKSKKSKIKKKSKKKTNYRSRSSIRKKRKLKKKVFKAKKRKKNKFNSKSIFIKIIRFEEKLKPRFKFNITDIDKFLQRFFQGIADRINEYKALRTEEIKRRQLLKNKEMQQEKLNVIKKLKLEKEQQLIEKKRELKEEIKLQKERKQELQKFIRLEQAEVRREQAQKQRKFLEQIKLEKRIEQFRKREELEIKNLEKFVLSQERESYTEVEARIEKIKQKYQALRDQKIRERVEQLGVKVEEGDDRSVLLEKERQYNLSRQKIETALESFYRSAHSLVFQLNKRYIPKYLSILRTIDRRFETGEIFIKFDESSDEEWLILIYIRDNDPDKGVVIEDKTNPEKNVSNEFNSNEIFKASDYMVDALTKLLDRERQKRKEN